MARADVVGVPAWRALRAFLAVVSFALAFGAVMLARGAMRGFGGPGGSDERIVVLAGIPMFTLTAVIFAGLTLFANAMVRRSASMAAREAQHPGKPWLWIEDWDGGRVLASGGLWPALGFARSLDGGVFKMSAVPGVVGGKVAGVVELPAKLRGGGSELRIALRCVQQTKQGPRGEGVSASWRVWQDETMVPAPSAALLPISFTVPYDVHESTLPWTPDTSYTWTLHIKAAGGGPAVHFDIPVFKTEASDPSIKAGVVDASRPAAQPPNSRTRVLESGADGAVIALPAIPGLVAGLIAALGLPIAAWAAGRFVAATPAWVPAAGLWLGVGLLVLAALAVFLTGTRIEVDRRALRVFHGMGGIGWTRTVPIGDIAAVKYDPAGTTEYGRVEAHLENGKSYWLAANLAGLEESKWLAAELTRAIERCRARASTA